MMLLTGSFMSVGHADVLGTGIDLEIVERAGSLQAGDDRVEGGSHAIVDLDVAHRGVARGS